MKRHVPFRYGLLIITVVTLVVKQVQAQATLGAREVALGQATTALSGSSWAVFSNPAMLDRHMFTLSFFGLRYYGLPELTDLGVAFTAPSSFGTFGLGAHRYGDDLYNESRLRLVYSNSFDRFYYGLAGTYHHVVMGGGYGSVGAIGLDVGLAAMLSKSLWVGATATNINQPRYGETDLQTEELVRSLSVGISYRIEEVVLITADVFKDVRFPISSRVGVELILVQHFSGRAGITIEPVTFSGGFGYEGDFLGINVVVQKHENPVLGLSPGLDFTISW